MANSELTAHKNGVLASIAVTRAAGRRSGEEGSRAVAEGQAQLAEARQALSALQATADQQARSASVTACMCLKPSGAPHQEAAVLCGHLYKGISSSNREIKLRLRTQGDHSPALGGVPQTWHNVYSLCPAYRSVESGSDDHPHGLRFVHRLMCCRQSRQAHARLKEAQTRLQVLQAEHAELVGQHDELLARSSSLQQLLRSARHDLKEVLAPASSFSMGYCCP